MCIRFVFVMLATFWLAEVTGQALADDYPSRPLRLIISSPPGGTADVLGRLVGQKLSESFGQQIVIDNRAGGGGNIGAEIVVRSAPDGYTLLLGQTQTLAVNPTLYKSLAFNPLRDFVPVAMVASVEFFLVAHPSVPAKTLPELIKLAKGKPGRLTFASASSGSTSHLAGELLKTTADIDMLHVPYKGAGPAVNDLIGGQVMLMFSAGPSISAQVKAGRLKLIAVAGNKRSSIFPAALTFAEFGIPDFNVNPWWGVVAPAKTPQAIVARLNREIAEALAKADVRQRLERQGANAVIMTPEEFGAFIRSEHARWSKVVYASGARVD